MSVNERSTSSWPWVSMPSQTSFLPSMEAMRQMLATSSAASMEVSIPWMKERSIFTLLTGNFCR
ncbi:hypothetical protein D3C81_2334310 [compost metagenome]